MTRLYTEAPPPPPSRPRREVASQIRVYKESSDERETPSPRSQPYELDEPGRSRRPDEDREHSRNGPSRQYKSAPPRPRTTAAEAALLNNLHPDSRAHEYGAESSAQLPLGMLATTPIGSIYRPSETIATGSNINITGKHAIDPELAPSARNSMMPPSGKTVPYRPRKTKKMPTSSSGSSAKWTSPNAWDRCMVRVPAAVARTEEEKHILCLEQCTVASENVPLKVFICLLCFQLEADVIRSRLASGELPLDSRANDGGVTRYGWNAKAHVGLKHINSRDKFSCTLCSSVVSRPGDAKRHAATHFGGIHQCNCGRGFSTLTKFTNHQEVCDSTIAAPQVEPVDAERFPTTGMDVGLEEGAEGERDGEHDIEVAQDSTSGDDRRPAKIPRIMEPAQSADPSPDSCPLKLLASVAEASGASSGDDYDTGSDSEGERVTPLSQAIRARGTDASGSGLRTTANATRGSGMRSTATSSSSSGLRVTAAVSKNRPSIARLIHAQ